MMPAAPAKPKFKPINAGCNSNGDTKQLVAQEALILMTDVAHNLLAWTTQWMFPSGPLAHFGLQRFTQDVLALPGRLVFEKKRLVEVYLNKRHPYACSGCD